MDGPSTVPRTAFDALLELPGTIQGVPFEPPATHDSGVNGSLVVASDDRPAQPEEVAGSLAGLAA